MLYFAYGSNMSTQYIHDYCPSAAFQLRGLLPNMSTSWDTMP